MLHTNKQNDATVLHKLHTWSVTKNINQWEWMPYLESTANNETNCFK